MVFFNETVLKRVVPLKFMIWILLILLLVQVLLDKNDHIYAGISETNSTSSSNFKSEERQLYAAICLYISFVVWQLLFMFLGITIHFVKTNLFQIIMHVTSVIYMTWSIYARWPVDYYWALVSILGFLPWILDISLLYWSVLRYRPRGVKKLKNVS